jgi:hypothetical protein
MSAPFSALEGDEVEQIRSILAEVDPVEEGVKLSGDASHRCSIHG